MTQQNQQWTEEYGLALEAEFLEQMQLAKKAKDEEAYMSATILHLQQKDINEYKAGKQNKSYF